MSSQTSNLGLYKPDLSDTVNTTIPQLSSNFDKIDSQVASNKQQLGEYEYIQNFPLLAGETDDTQRLLRAIQQGLVDNKPVLIGRETITVSQTLTANHLHAVSIIGLGKTISTIKFVGNIDCFNFDAVGKFLLDKVGIEVDTTNNHDVFKIAPVNATAYGVVIGDDVEIRCPSYATGQYTGIHITATETGCYNNTFGKITMFWPGNGILLDSVTPTTGVPWATSNKFYSPVIKGYQNIGIGIQRATATNTQISDNVFISPQAHDNVDGTGTNNQRFGYVIDGQFNTFIGIAHWADTPDKTNCIGIKFIDRSELGYNVIDGGHVEGAIINKYMMFGNTCNFLHAGNVNNPYWTVQKSTIKNILPNPNFKYGLAQHTLSSATGSIASEAIPTGRKLTINSTGTNGQVMTNLNKNSAMVGQRLVFIASFKSSATVRLIIDEGSENQSVDFAPTSGGTGYHTALISKQINVNNTTLALSVMLMGGSGLTADIAYMYAMIVQDSQLPSSLVVEDVGYGQTGNSGTVTLPSGTTIAVNHGLGYTPDITDIIVTSTSTLGSAKTFWVENVNSTSFNITIDTAAGGGVTFAWKIVPK